MSSASNSIPRRDFLVQSSAVTAGAVGLAMTPPLAAATVPDRQHAKFNDLVGEKFTVSQRTEQGTQTAVVTLSDVKSHKTDSDQQRPSHLRESAFSLLFQATQGADLSDGIYRVKHPKLGTSDLFLHPTMCEANSRNEHLVAVFN